MPIGMLRGFDSRRLHLSPQLSAAATSIGPP